MLDVKGYAEIKHYEKKKFSIHKHIPLAAGGTSQNDPPCYAVDPQIHWQILAMLRYGPEDPLMVIPMKNIFKI